MTRAEAAEAGASPDDGVEIGHDLFDLYVTGPDADRLSAKLPALRCREREDAVVLSAVLDAPALRFLSRRLAALGCRLTGFTVAPT
jgi:hypothetical protein